MLNPPADGRLSKTPTTVNRSVPIRMVLPIGSMPFGSNSSCTAVLPSTTTFAPLLHLGAAEEAAGDDRDAGAVGEILGRAEDEERPRLLVAVEDALHRTGPGRRAQLDVDDLQRRAPAPRWRGHRRSSGSGRLISSVNSAPLAKLVMPNRWMKIVFGPELR